MSHLISSAVAGSAGSSPHVMARTARVAIPMVGRGVSSHSRPPFSSATTPSKSAAGHRRYHSLNRAFGSDTGVPARERRWTRQYPPARRTFHVSTTLASVKDPYKVLGVSKDASAGEIKRAYYGMAKKYHPDTSKEANAKDKFTEAQSAYELLSDEKKREAYDRYGNSAFDQNGGFHPGAAGAGPGAGPGNPFGGFGGFSGFGGFGGGQSQTINFEDLFGAFTGRQGGGGRSSSRSDPFSQQILVGDNIEVHATISFLEAAKGTVKKVTVNALRTCDTCSGTGLRKGVKASECPACDGSGTRVHLMQGGFQVASTCNRCDGTGVSVPRGSECGTCRGHGVTQKKETVTIQIPAGVEDGMRLRVTEAGHAPETGGSNGGNKPRTRNGELFVFVNVQPDPKFGRNGPDVLYTASIPLTTAVLGGEIEVPTLDGAVRLRVPTGTSTGDKITLSGRGMARLSAGLLSRSKGDMRVEFKVSMPKHLSSNQQALFEMLADAIDDKTAKRTMNLHRSSGTGTESGSGSETASAEDHTNEGFLKSAWHTITGQHSNLKPGPKEGEDDEKDRK